MWEGWLRHSQYAGGVTPKGRLMGILMVGTKQGPHPGRHSKLRMYKCDSHLDLQHQQPGACERYRFLDPTLESETLGMWSSSLGDSDFPRSAQILTKHSRKRFKMFLCVVGCVCAGEAALTVAVMLNNERAFCMVGDTDSDGPGKEEMVEEKRSRLDFPGVCRQYLHCFSLKDS